MFNEILKVYVKKKGPDVGVFKPQLVTRIDKQTLYVVYK
jgi:hypothetical protein